jgi:hypothetical protein
MCQALDPRAEGLLGSNLTLGSYVLVSAPFLFPNSENYSSFAW